jgi:Uma2 family endonuclease
MTIEARAREVYDRTMAATATTPAPLAPAPFRFTRELYHRLGAIGIFDGVRVELLDGEIVRMSPQGVPHAGTITRFTRVLMAALGRLFTIRVQLPLVLGEDSEPEPDFVVCDYDPDDYTRAHPALIQVHLVVEVAFTSVEYDRGRKRTAYARAGMPLYWLVNLPDRGFEVYSEPDPSAGLYRRTERRVAGERLELPGGARLDAADLLPPPDPSPKG